MSVIEVLTRVVWVEATALVLLVFVYFGHGIWTARADRRLAVELERGRPWLRAAVEGQPLPAPPRLGRRTQIRLLAELAPSLQGASRARLSQAAAELGLVRYGQDLTSSRRWWKRLEGVRLLDLIQSGGDRVPALLADPNPQVRSAAVAWAAAHPTPAAVGRLIGLLHDAGPAGRFPVRDALARMGADAVPQLVAYMLTCDPGGTGVSGALEVAIAAADSRYLEPALRLCTSPVPRTRALAALLAGELGSVAALQRLRELLRDESPEVRAASCRAIGSLGDWQAAPAIAAQLSHSAWSVRREAGLALRRFGAPGLLYLHRALEGSDRFAADMARQVLDVPEAAEWEPALW